MEKQGAHNTPRSQSHHGGSGGGGREDCWSEGATETLVEAWGSRYLRLNRGNLRQRDWKEVADAVNARQNGVKPRKTDIQCKNRIDTLKKKYKLEKAKPPPSKWPFYSRLNSLIGTNSASTTTSKKPTTGVTFTVKHSKQFLNPNPSPSPNFAVYSNASSSKSKLNSAGSTESSYGGGTDDNDNDNYDDEYEEDDEPLSLKLRKNRMYSVDLSDDAACRELARAILKFGEIYERIESSKQQKIMELERQRMEYTRDLESQRMNMFMEAQLELQKIKRPKHAPGSGKKL